MLPRILYRNWNRKQPPISSEDSYDEEEIPGTLSTRPPTPLEWYARHQVSPRLFMLPHFFWGRHKLALVRYRCSSGCLSGFTVLGTTWLKRLTQQFRIVSAPRGLLSSHPPDTPHVFLSHTQTHPGPPG
ncbi:hypothetical protein HYDPIDRAFT_115454 [Hydnomerulius pinastri MD-312]|uniref:Uncharacterized protein n=1 Tax=Hydnomerulius pinastri MD-312 TaxID=994086 RepID=A0A0C9VUJ6_9AGAM|nr:hypothetical protein HYDPIDRAFT_115454 [Hydnomerulius pinastri MD-312]